MGKNEDFGIENSKAQMRKGMLEYCILMIISSGEVYASDILRELKDANLLVVEGTLYPLLSRLRSDGALKYTWAESQSGPPRKYYTLTARGREILRQLNENWHFFSQSINALIKKHEKND